MEKDVFYLVLCLVLGEEESAIRSIPYRVFIVFLWFIFREERNTSCCLRKHKRVDYLKLSGEVCDDNVSLSTIHPRRRNHKVSHTDQYLQRIQKEVSSYRHYDKTCGLESSPQINQMSRQMLSYTGPICYSYQNTIPVMLLPSGSLQPVMFVTPGFQPVMYPVPYPAFPQGAVMPGQTEESIPLAQSGDSFTMLPTVKMEGCSKLSQSVLPSDAYSSGSCTLPSYSAVDSRSDS